GPTTRLPALPAPLGPCGPLSSRDGFLRAPRPTWPVPQLLSASTRILGAAEAEHGEILAAGGQAGSGG
ncbi:MAG: hypothetical protein ACK56F_25470, partial [bacterium]